LIGLAVLISIAAISTFMSTVFGFDLLKPNFSSISAGTGSGGGGGGTSGGNNSACPGGLSLGGTGSDGGAGGYCTNSGAAMMKCFEAGQGSGLPYVHLDPCSCITGTLKPGYTFPAGC
jgi:hypothetical protein